MRRPFEESPPQALQEKEGSTPEPAFPLGVPVSAFMMGPWAERWQVAAVVSPRLNRHRPRDHSHQGTSTPGEGWNHSAEGKRSGLKETASLDKAPGASSESSSGRTWGEGDTQTLLISPPQPWETWRWAGCGQARPSFCCCQDSHRGGCAGRRRCSDLLTTGFDGYRRGL